MPKGKRVGVALAPQDLRAGMKLTAPRKGVSYLVVRTTQSQILVRFRKGARGRWSERIYEIAPAEITGFLIEED